MWQHKCLGSITESKPSLLRKTRRISHRGHGRHPALRTPPKLSICPSRGPKSPDEHRDFVVNSRGPFGDTKHEKIEIVLQYLRGGA